MNFSLCVQILKSRPEGVLWPGAGAARDSSRQTAQGRGQCGRSGLPAAQAARKPVLTRMDGGAGDAEVAVLEAHLLDPLRAGFLVETSCSRRRGIVADGVKS